MNEEIAAALSEVYTTLPGKIVAYDGVTATVRPALSKLLSNGEVLAPPQIVRVPVHWFIADGGRALITVPLKPGDDVTLHFACRSVENWLNGSDGPPDDPRQFDLTDCFCTPVMRPGPRADTENVHVGYGKAAMKISPDGVFTFTGERAVFELPTFFNELMTYSAGLIGAGGEGSTIAITGDVNFTGGTITHDGKVIDSTHRHDEVESGSDISGEVV